uniref:hypothetical protein n=1 Tax=Rhodoferax sp. TaxID=50421 RepID=UPI0027298DF0|nr:hypothetical protein [Rhodoferax sp.]
MKLPSDKLLHFSVGATITVLVVIATGSLALAGAAVLLVGAGREVYDAYHPDTNTADIWDMVATCAGWIPVALVVQLTQL